MAKKVKRRTDVCSKCVSYLPGAPACTAGHVQYDVDLTRCASFESPPRVEVVKPKESGADK